MNGVTLKEIVSTLMKHGEADMAERVGKGFIDLCWASEDGEYTVLQPIHDLQQCGTPIVPSGFEQEGDDCILAPPIPLSLPV